MWACPLAECECKYQQFEESPKHSFQPKWLLVNVWACITPFEFLFMSILYNIVIVKFFNLRLAHKYCLYYLWVKSVPMLEIPRNMDGNFTGLLRWTVDKFEDYKEGAMNSTLSSHIYDYIEWQTWGNLHSTLLQWKPGCFHNAAGSPEVQQTIIHRSH